MNTLVLRWKDKDGKEHRKEYDARQSADVAKAKRWLLDNGAKDVDVAVKIERKGNTSETKNHNRPIV